MYRLAIFLCALLAGCGQIGCMCQEGGWFARDSSGKIVAAQQSGQAAEIDVKLPPKMNLALCAC